MRRPRALLAAVMGVILAGCEPSSETPAPASPPIAQLPAPAPPPASDKIPVGTGFDFYVLSLSCSPSYCEAEGADANQQQCKASRPYAFVVHGLWPQFEHGFPEDCPTGDTKVSDETVRSLYDLMPSAGLIRHEWTAHGACSGLSQTDYFGVLRAAREKIAIPEQFRQLGDYLTARRARWKARSSRRMTACRPTVWPSPATSAICARCASVSRGNSATVPAPRSTGAIAASTRR